MSKISNFLIMIGLCISFNISDTQSMDSKNSESGESCWKDVKCALTFATVNMAVAGVCLAWSILNRDMVNDAQVNCPTNCTALAPLFTQFNCTN